MIPIQAVGVSIPVLDRVKMLSVISPRISEIITFLAKPITILSIP